MRIPKKWMTALLGCAMTLGTVSAAHAQTYMMTNSGGYLGDPTVIWVPELGAYLGARTDGITGGITLWKSERLEDLFQSPSRYTVPADGSGHEAPGLLAWTDPSTGVKSLYIGYKGDNGIHQTVKNPYVTDPFCTSHAHCWTNMTVGSGGSRLPGRDWSYFVHGGKLWAFYSDAAGSGPNGVFVQLLNNPNTLNPSHPAVQLSKAIAPDGSGANKEQARVWEFRHNNMDGTNEAPVAFSRADSTGHLWTWVTYSANAYRFSDYDMGLLTFAGGENADLDDASQWTKSQNPAFQARSYSTTAGDVQWVCNVGSNSIVRSPDGTEFWHVYNGKGNCSTVANPDYNPRQPAGPFNQPTQLASPNDRSIRVQKISFDDNGQPVFGSPWVDGELHAPPSGEANVPPYAFLTPTSSSQTFDDAYGRIDPSTGNQSAYDDVSSRIFYSDNFTSTTGNPNARGNGGNIQGSLTSSRADGSYFVVAFNGSRVQLSGPVGSYTDGAGRTATQGKIKIYVDGVMLNPVNKNLGSLSSPLWFDSDVDLGSGVLTSGPHALLVVVGGSNPVQLDSVTVFQ